VVSEPAANRRFVGTLFTLSDLPSLLPLEAVKIEPVLTTDGLTPAGLERILQHAAPVAPDDRLIDEWHYVPWQRASFRSRGATWTLELHLGMGFLAEERGRRGAFRFDVRDAQAHP
jgi:hypothetical protein